MGGRRSWISIGVKEGWVDRRDDLSRDSKDSGDRWVGGMEGSVGC